MPLQPVFWGDVFLLVLTHSFCWHPPHPLVPSGFLLSLKLARYTHLGGKEKRKLSLPIIVGYRDASPPHFFPLPNLGWSLHPGCPAAPGLGTYHQHIAVGGGWSHLVGRRGTKRALSGGIKKWDESSLYPLGTSFLAPILRNLLWKRSLSWCFRVLSQV